MPRPKNDGTPADPPNRRRLNEFYVRQTKPRPNRYFDTWDKKRPGLILRIQPTGHRAWPAPLRWARPARSSPNWRGESPVVRIRPPIVRPNAMRVRLPN